MENNLFKSGVLLFALGSMSCISLWAQGTVEDYNRAYALREKYNAKHVLYAGVVPHWVDQTSERDQGDRRSICKDRDSCSIQQLSTPLDTGCSYGST